MYSVALKCGGRGSGALEWASRCHCNTDLAVSCALLKMAISVML